MAPESRELHSLLYSAAASGRLAAGAEWVEYEEAVVYRWLGASVSGKLSCAISDGKLTELWDAERRPLNLPALIIEVDNRRITLRLHPRHGSIGDLGKVKDAFAPALRQRERCKVDWLD